MTLLRLGSHCGSLRVLCACGLEYALTPALLPRRFSRSRSLPWPPCIWSRAVPLPAVRDRAFGVQLGRHQGAEWLSDRDGNPSHSLALRFLYEDIETRWGEEHVPNAVTQSWRLSGAGRAGWSYRWTTRSTKREGQQRI